MANSDSNSNDRSYVKPEYPLSDITGKIIASAMEVHTNLGPGFEEIFYQRTLELELPDHNKFITLILSVFFLFSAFIFFILSVVQ